MPDWSYRTLLRPALFALPTRAARDLSLATMGALGSAWPGRVLIDLLGHMRPPDGLAVRVAGLTFPSRMGIGCGLDPELRATSALARFGCGFVEVGPIVAGGARRRGLLQRDDAGASLVLADPLEGTDLASAVARLAQVHAAGALILARLDASGVADPDAAGREIAGAIDALAPHVAGFTVACGDASWAPEAWRAVAEELQASAHAVRRPLFLVVPPGATAVDLQSRLAAGRGGDGFVVDGSARLGDGRRVMGRRLRADAVATIRAIRDACGSAVPILASAGIHEPQDALDAIAAGADLLAIDSGLVFGGPGLPKRVNEALEAISATFSTADPKASGVSPDATSGAAPEAAPQMSWLWTLLLGVGMLMGSAMALGIAATRVVLPYDEQFVGLLRHELAAINPRLLPFLTHDRVTLAGAMAAIGVLYTGLSWFGARHGRHWAHVAILASAVAGFVSFFLFLGFGYFDPFHAFVTAILFQLLLFAVHGRMARPSHVPPPMRTEDAAWRLGLWGQLGFVVQGAGFMGAGLIISTIGATHVFVHEDLEFLQTTASTLAAVRPHLVPLVAHDRATLGGMLLASGLTIVLTALWGFRPGERWLWWTLLAAGIPGYVAAIGVHYVVGYHSTFHLAPAFVGLAIFVAALAASYPSLCRR